MRRSATSSGKSSFSSKRRQAAGSPPRSGNCIGCTEPGQPRRMFGIAWRAPARIAFGRSLMHFRHHALGGFGAVQRDDEGARTPERRHVRINLVPAGVAEIDAASLFAIFGHQLAIGIERDPGHVFAVEHARDHLADAAEAADHDMIAQFVPSRPPAHDVMLDRLEPVARSGARRSPATASPSCSVPRRRSPRSRSVVEEALAAARGRSR